MKILKDKVAVVTGAGSGMGRSTGIALAREVGQLARTFDQMAAALEQRERGVDARPAVQRPAWSHPTSGRTARNQAVASHLGRAA